MTEITNAEHDDQMAREALAAQVRDPIATKFDIDEAEDELRAFSARCDARLAQLRSERDSLNAEIKRLVQTTDVAAKAVAVFDRHRRGRTDA